MSALGENGHALRLARTAGLGRYSLSPTPLHTSPQFSRNLSHHETEGPSHAELRPVPVEQPQSSLPSFAPPFRSKEAHKNSPVALFR